MKKLLTLTVIATAFACLQSSAQLQKGEKALGTTLSLIKVKSENKSIYGTISNETTGFVISPDLSFGLGNNWMAGAGAGYTYSKQKSAGSNTSTTTSQGVAGNVFVRKFFPIGGGKFGLFGQGNVAYEHFKNESLYPSAKTTSNAIDVAVQGGAYLRASKRFIVETRVGSISYSHLSGKYHDGSNAKATSNSFNFSLVDDLTLGFKIVL